MQSIQEAMNEFQEQLKRGAVQQAYKALLDFMLDLRTHFQKMYPGYTVSGLYQGTMDMTYFAIVPPFLKERGLKIAIVFNYDPFRFEAWLSGTNRQIQRKYWELIKDSQWSDYRVVTPAKGIDSIVEYDLAEEFDFSDLGSLTTRIEANTVQFINDVERFVVGHELK